MILYHGIYNLLNFRIKIGPSLSDYLTILDEEFPFLIIEKDKFEDFKNEVRKLKRKKMV